MSSGPIGERDLSSAVERAGLPKAMKVIIISGGCVTVSHQRTEGGFLWGLGNHGHLVG